MLLEHPVSFPWKVECLKSILPSPILLFCWQKYCQCLIPQNDANVRDTTLSLCFSWSIVKTELAWLSSLDHGLYMGSFFVCVQLDKDLIIIKLELFYLPLLLCMFNLHVWITSQVIAIKNSLLRLRVAYLFSRPEWKWGGGAKGLIWFSLDSFPGVRLRFESNSGMPNMGKLSWALELKMSGPHAHTPCDLHWPSLKKNACIVSMCLHDLICWLSLKNAICRWK